MNTTKSATEGAGSIDRKETDMMVNLSYISPLVALVAGILILFVPRLLNLIVAIYLIVIGVLGLAGQL